MAARSVGLLRQRRRQLRPDDRRADGSAAIRGDSYWCFVLYVFTAGRAGQPGRNLTAIIDYVHLVFCFIVRRWPRHVAGEVRCPRHTSGVLPGALSRTRRSREWRPRI